MFLVPLLLRRKQGIQRPTFSVSFSWNVCNGYWQFASIQNMDRETLYGLVQGQRKVLNRSFTPFLNMEIEKGLLFWGLWWKVAAIWKGVGVYLRICNLCSSVQWGAMIFKGN